MNLFSKKKDLIHRINNFILVIWFVIATFTLYSSVVNLVVKKPLLNYKDFSNNYCVKDYMNIGKDNEIYCKQLFNDHKIMEQEDKYNAKKTLLYAIGNLVIVGSAIFILNRK